MRLNPIGSPIRNHVRRAEQDELAHPGRAVKGNQLLASVEHVDRAIAQVVARDQAAHAVSDDVDAKARVLVIAAKCLDHPVEPARRVDVVLSPVIRIDVVAPLTRHAGSAGRRFHIAAEALQRFDDLAVEIPS
jgi:hypothetical protein